MAELSRDAALPQINGSIKRLRQTPQIMRRRQHAGSAASLFTQHFIDDIPSRLVDGIQGLIQQKQTGSLNDRSRQQRALLLATGKLTNLTLGQIGNLKTIQTLSHCFQILSAWSLQPAQMHVSPCHHKIGDRHRKSPIQIRALRQIGGSMMAGSNAISEETDRSRHGLQQASDRFQKGTFPRSVRANKRYSLSNINDKRSSQDGRPSRMLIAHGHILQIDRRATRLWIFVASPSIGQPRVDMMRMLRARTTSMGGHFTAKL
jgi:hypothetical protein